MIDPPGTAFLRAVGRLGFVLGAAGLTLGACGEGDGFLQSNDKCPSGEVRYVGQGLTLLVPDGVNPDTGYTADSGPVHSSGEVVFTLDGGEVQIWRSPERPSDADTTLVAIKSGVGSQWFYVRSSRPDLNQCILDSLTYDRALDEADE